MSSGKPFQYNITKNRDMRNLYKRVIEDFGGFPMFLLMDELEDGSNLLVRRLENGRPLFYVKNTSDANVIKEILKALKTKKYNEFPSLDFENSYLELFEIVKWMQCICCVADILDVDCPQVLFTHGEDAGTSAGEILVIPDELPNIDTFIAIVHEFRHVWQHKHHPEWSDEYVHPEEDLEGYFNQKAELDAEAFARRFVGRVLEIDDAEDLMDSLYYDENPKMKEKLYRTAMDMSLVDFFSKEDEMEFLRRIMM